MKNFMACMKLNKDDDSSLKQIFGHKKRKSQEMTCA